MKFRVNIVYLWLVNQWYTKNNSLRYPPTNVKLYIIGGLPSGSLGSSTSCWIMAHMRKTKKMKKTQSLKKCRLMNFHENMFYFTHKSPRAVWPSKIGTLQGTKRSHLGKRKHVFKHDLDVVSFWEGKLGGSFKHFLFHPDPWGNDPYWRAYVSNGLVQPPTIGKACFPHVCPANTAVGGWLQMVSLNGQARDKVDLFHPHEKEWATEDLTGCTWS